MIQMATAVIGHAEIALTGSMPWVREPFSLGPSASGLELFSQKPEPGAKDMLLVAIGGTLQKHPPPNDAL